jgi:hypothetical protein
MEVGTAGQGWLSHLSHIYKDACGLAQAKGLPSLIYHEPAIEVKFMRGAAGTTRILTIRPKHLNCNRPMSGVVIVGVSVDFKVSCPEPLSAIRKEIWKEL